ncbi:hypothetical protein [Pseudomonas sp. AS2.8]|uniref:hypothetical protein n=1 Tax=Pseudomonas sp. AS2.8 TaxID=2587128 RepID=UPI001607C5BD|nr:hypothetical protein [Pseudomonas sp. AS2.8]MBB2895465.1 hypothetical protein [Pseudomonas sp. AS2.8]
MTPATYILLLVLGWLALALAILWAMLRLARRARPATTSAPRELPTATPTAPVSPGKHMVC